MQNGSKLISVLN